MILSVLKEQELLLRVSIKELVDLGVSKGSVDIVRDFNKATEDILKYVRENELIPRYKDLNSRKSWVSGDSFFSYIYNCTTVHFTLKHNDVSNTCDCLSCRLWYYEDTNDIISIDLNLYDIDASDDSKLLNKLYTNNKIILYVILKSEYIDYLVMLAKILIGVENSPDESVLFEYNSDYYLAVEFKSSYFSEENFISIASEYATVEGDMLQELKENGKVTIGGNALIKLSNM